MFIVMLYQLRSFIGEPFLLFRSHISAVMIVSQSPKIDFFFANGRDVVQAVSAALHTRNFEIF